MVESGAASPARQSAGKDSNSSRYGLVIIVIVIVLAVLIFQRINTARNLNIARQDAKSGLNLFKKGKFKEAIPKLEEAARLNPNDSSAQRTLAHSYEATGKLDRAANAYKDSLAADPKQAEVLYNLAIIYKSQGKNKQAIEELEKALSLNKNFVAARLILGDLYLQQGSKSQAKEQYQTVIDMKPFGVDLEAVKQKLEAVK